MANNILNKSAMESIARIESEIKHLVDTVGVLTTEQKCTSRAIQDISKQQVQVDGRLDAIETAINEIPQKCPFRESISRSAEAVDSIKDAERDRKEIRGNITEMKEDIASLKTTDKIYGGANALFTVIATTITQILANFGGNP